LWSRGEGWRRGGIHLRAESGGSVGESRARRAGLEAQSVEFEADPAGLGTDGASLAARRPGLRAGTAGAGAGLSDAEAGRSGAGTAGPSREAETMYRTSA
jgi:hypothetical protein